MYSEFDKVEEVLKELRDALGNIPILMTFRTSKEGGEKAIEPEAYAKLNIKAAQTGYVDFVDVEIFTGDEIVKKIIDGVHAAGARVFSFFFFIASMTFKLIIFLKFKERKEILKISYIRKKYLIYTSLV